MTNAPETFLQDTAKAARAEIEQLKARASEVLKKELHGIAKAAAGDDGRSLELRLKRRNTLDELVTNAAWLATSLVDVLVKVASEREPSPVMASDLSTRIREAEIRLELLREMTRN